MSAALYNGLKREAATCDLCQGTGGIKCFACQDGTMPRLISKEELMDSKPKRDVVGRTLNPRACRACRGAAFLLCSKCKGMGLV